MNKLSFYLRLLKQIESVKEDLDLCHLTSSDRYVLIIMMDLAENESSKVFLSYMKFKSLSCKNKVEISRSQFFKSIARLEELGLITRVDSPRSSCYIIHLE